MGFVVFAVLGLLGALTGRLIDRGTGADLAVVGLALAVFGWLAAPPDVEDWLVDPGMGLALGSCASFAVWWAAGRWWSDLPAALRQRRIERDARGGRPTA